MTAALTVLSGITLLMICVWTLYQRPKTTPAQRAWLRFCKRLKRFGIIRADWEGPLAFAARVAKENAALGSITHQAARHFADLHYGDGKPEQLQQLKKCTRLLSKQKPPPRRNKV